MRWILTLFGLIVFGIILSYLWSDWRLKPLDETARQSAPGQHVTLSAGQLHYRWSGPEQGPIIVLVHGFSTPNFIYEQNVQALNAAGFRTLRYDHFGRGWSDRPRVTYDIDFYDQTLLELLDSQGIRTPIGLVGLSMGGPIVAEFAARHPDRVARLVLLVPAGLDTAGADSTAARLIAIPGVGDWLWRLFGRGILLGDPQYQEDALAPSDRLAGDVTVQMSYRGYFDALLSTLRHMPMTGRVATYSRLSDTGIPVLALYGDEDETVLISSAAKLVQLMPDADVRTIVGGMHGLNYQRHAQINPLLIEMFQPLLPTAPQDAP